MSRGTAMRDDGDAHFGVPRPLPALNNENTDFWTGGGQGRLMIAQCGMCRTYIHPPLPRCPKCGGADVKATPVSGRGKVKTCTVNRQIWVPGLDVPFVFAAVELEEQAGLYVMTNIIGCEPQSVTAGMAVEVVFEPQEDIFLPLFRPAPSVQA